MGCIDSGGTIGVSPITTPGSVAAAAAITAEDRQHPLPVHAASGELSDALQALDNAVGELEHRLAPVLTPTEPEENIKMALGLAGISVHADYLYSRARWAADLHQRVVHILDRLEL